MRARSSWVLVAAMCCVVISSVSVMRASALLKDEDEIDKYAANDVMFYDKTENNSGSSACVSSSSVDESSGSGLMSLQDVETSLQDVTVNVSGTTIQEKVWNGLKSLGLTDEVTAGAMGNMYYESAMSPARHEQSGLDNLWPMALDKYPKIAYGIGLIQWSYDRRIDVYNYIEQQSPGLAKKFFGHPETYSTKPTIGGNQFLAKVKELGTQDEADNLLALELVFLVNKELTVKEKYKPVLNETTVKGAAEQFSIRVEACKPCRDVTTKSVKDRVSKAQEYYDKFKGTGGTSGTGGTGGTGTGGTGTGGVTIGERFGLTRIGAGVNKNRCTVDGGDDDTGGGGSDNPYGEGGYQGDDYTYTGDVESLQHLVKEWAWGKYYSKANRPIAEQTPAYRAHTPKHGGCNGNDCGGFVADTIVQSGWDKSFKYQAVRYMQDTLWSSSTWKEVTSQIHSDNDMKPGDIIICSWKAVHHSAKCADTNKKTGHVMLWVGTISGFSSKIASASYNNNGKPCSGTRAPSASQSTGNIMHFINDSGYSIYRKVK